jgi:hypothetical protein
MTGNGTVKRLAGLAVTKDAEVPNKRPAPRRIRLMLSHHLFTLYGEGRSG